MSKNCFLINTILSALINILKVMVNLLIKIKEHFKQEKSQTLLKKRKSYLIIKAPEAPRVRAVFRLGLYLWI